VSEIWLFFLKSFSSASLIPEKGAHWFLWCIGILLLSGFLNLLNCLLRSLWFPYNKTILLVFQWLCLSDIVFILNIFLSLSEAILKFHHLSNYQISTWNVDFLLTFRSWLAFFWFLCTSLLRGLGFPLLWFCIVLFGWHRIDDYLDLVLKYKVLMKLFYKIRSQLRLKNKTKNMYLVLNKMKKYAKINFFLT